LKQLSTISAVGRSLIEHKFSEPSSKAEEFAQKRFLSKLEVPDSKNQKQRADEAWRNWLESDRTLQLPPLLKPDWARAKLILAGILKDFHIGPVSFTNGSEFHPTNGFGSIESKLRRSKWTCTYDNFDLWYTTVMSHHGLKLAFRKRFASVGK